MSLVIARLSHHWVAYDCVAQELLVYEIEYCNVYGNMYSVGKVLGAGITKLCRIR